MTVAEVIAAVRPLIDDADVTEYRLSDTTHFLPWCISAQSMVLKLRPDLYLDTMGRKIETPATLSGTSSEFFIPDDFKEPVMEFLMFRAYQCEAWDRRDLEASKSHWEMFLSMVRL
jgi:hypothetical protein